MAILRPASIFANGTGIQPPPSSPGSPQSPSRLETPSPSPFIHILPLSEASDDVGTRQAEETTELPNESPYVHIIPLADTIVEPTPQDGHGDNNTGDAMETEADNWEVNANLADWGIPENTEKPRNCLFSVMSE